MNVNMASGIDVSGLDHSTVIDLCLSLPKEYRRNSFPLARILTPIKRRLREFAAAPLPAQNIPDIPSLTFTDYELLPIIERDQPTLTGDLLGA